ncbi:VCBS repeat-containing protein [Trichocoleus sp. ST-U1]
MAELPDIQCQGEVPQPVKATLGEHRLAKESDFVPSIRNFKSSETPNKKFTCSIFSADFNQDGLKDYAMLLVAEETADSRFQIALNQGNGKFERSLVKDYRRTTKPEEGVIYTSMDLKSAGEKGLANRKYSPLKAESIEEKTYISTPAIELWKVSKTDEPPKQLDVDSLAYCSEAFYFVEDEQKNFAVCD